MNKFSLVILFFNRIDRVKLQVDYLHKLTKKNIEFIFVDNCSDFKVADLVNCQEYNVVRNNINYGAVGRNKGIEMATGEIVITLDDDVYGISNNDLRELEYLFKDESVAAVNFSVREEGSRRIINWCHPYDVDKFYNLMFETNEISEGAVALRRSALEKVGLYPEYFFISHEGPDLAFRLINAGFRVIYSPDIVVTHAYDHRSRPNWRRYYFDTRNLLWLVLRNLSGWHAVRRLIIGWCAMFAYSARDGFLRYWLRAIWDSLKGAPRAWRDRHPPNADAQKKWREIERNKPGFWKMVKLRLLNHQVKI
jgi:GT2 family glycosyltransferase